ncbi:single-stranded DNA-binding protein [Longibaculum muris]|uniref:single-stranded DNA-binding protein n=2 Tax=Longibaculum muris TaxID=1796628 RepID=UPI0022E2B2CD|nr:single-stranded DNA-binding protein [Longibaculum muris]
MSVFIYTCKQGGNIKMFNEIILIGKLAGRPVVKETQNGVKLSTIVVDVERPYRNNLGIKDHDYIRCILWKGIAQEVADCCDIGSFIGLKGRLQSRTYETSDQQTSTVMEVKIEHVEFLEKYLVSK